MQELVVESLRACPWLAASARPVAAGATIAGWLVPVVWTRPAAPRRAVPGPGRPQLRAGAGGTRALTRWCGARAGRVRAPAGRLRLCVLFQISDELIPGLEQFLLVDDVVAVEDGAGLVAGQEHGDPLGQGRNAGSYTYPDMRWTAT